ncbi:hypothetical protein M758_10G104900 [Ceratodon purpureus]|nr:hypothetical protein M758_10G104900 [Ceratodon purpureus]
MPSEEENRVVYVTHMYQSQIQQCQKMVNGANNGQSRAFGSDEGLKLPQQRVESMGLDSGPEVLQGSDYFEKRRSFDPPQDRKSDHPVVVSKSLEEDTDLRNRIARQWSCPAFAWKALEAMPVRNLFRVTQSCKEQKPLKEADENYIRTGESLLSGVEEGGLSEKKLVTIVLAFQRWRHSQLKNIIGQELRKVLEEAREDENALASLSTELEQAEQQLATARANSSRLHSQLAMAMNSTDHENGSSADNTSVRFSALNPIVDPSMNNQIF